MEQNRSEPVRDTTPDLNPPGAVDPVTGTTPVGPVHSAGAAKRRGNWPVAAQWFIGALLALGFGAILYWAF